MDYYVYENWQAGPPKAVIHIGTCGFCNDGKGLSKGDYNRSHGRWHREGDTLEKARATARALCTVEIRECRCVKH
jgi:hypothetical protein